MFGKRLRELRKEKGLTQTELSNKFEKAKSSISGYERGNRKPDLNLAVRIADYFNVSVDFILGRSNLKRTRGEIVELLEENPRLLALLESLSEKELKVINGLHNLNKQDLELVEQLIERLNN